MIQCPRCDSENVILTEIPIADENDHTEVVCLLECLACGNVWEDNDTA